MKANYKKLDSLFEIDKTEFKEFNKTQKSLQSIIERNGIKLTLVLVENRHKIFLNGKYRIKILNGNGFIKWEKGEIDFAKNDLIEIVTENEIDINGKSEIVYFMEEEK